MSVTCSVITPSYNMLGYLKRCVASVADQGPDGLEHIVVDGFSTDGTVDWLAGQRALRAVVEPDRGMYDAINKGLLKAEGEFLAYLSCDEQYLPGAIAAASGYLVRHPDVDVVFGDTLVTRPDGSLVCFRKAYPAIWPLIAISDLYNFPSSMFFRRRVIDDGNLFDPSLKDVGDAEFVVRLLRKGYRTGVLRRYLSSFTLTGANRSQDPRVAAEHVALEAGLPAWLPRARKPLNALRLALKVASGAYWQRSPLRYAVYAGDPSAGRMVFESARPSPRWRLA